MSGFLGGVLLESNKKKGATMPIREALVREIINVTLTLADTAYQIVLPRGTKQWSMQCRTGFPVRFAFESGKVEGANGTAPFGTIKSGGAYTEESGFGRQTSPQIDTITIADTWAQNDTVTIDVGGTEVVVTIGTLVTTTQVATTIKQAWMNETLTDSAASYTPDNGGQEKAITSRLTATNLLTTGAASAVVELRSQKDTIAFTMTATEVTAGDGSATAATTAGQNSEPIVYLAADEAAVVVELVLLRDVR